MSGDWVLQMMYMSSSMALLTFKRTVRTDSVSSHPVSQGDALCHWWNHWENWVDISSTSFLIFPFLKGCSLQTSLATRLQFWGGSVLWSNLNLAGFAIQSIGFVFNVLICSGHGAGRFCEHHIPHESQLGFGVVKINKGTSYFYFWHAERGYPCNKLVLISFL